MKPLSCHPITAECDVLYQIDYVVSLFLTSAVYIYRATMNNDMNQPPQES